MYTRRNFLKLVGIAVLSWFCPWLKDEKVVAAPIEPGIDPRPWIRRTYFRKMSYTDKCKFGFPVGYEDVMDLDHPFNNVKWYEDPIKPNTKSMYNVRLREDIRKAMRG